MTTQAFKFQSPLESLLRRKPEPAPLYPAQSYNSNSVSTIPQTPDRPSHQSQPTSPLLHSHFARHSTATASSYDNNSYLRASIDSRNVYQDPELEYRYYDNESIYSNTTGPALRDSWRSAASGDTTRAVSYPLRPETVTHTRSQPNYFREPPSPSSPLPTVIVSSPTDPQVSHAGRMPIVKPIANNFSRPVRPPIYNTPEVEEQKRRVLERNARRAASPSISQQDLSRPPRALSPFDASRVPSQKSSTSERPQSPSVSIRIAESGGRNPPSIEERAILPASLQSHQRAPNMRLSPSAPANLQNRQPPRNDSPVSLYSTYSYYQLDASTPSPTVNAFLDVPLDALAFSSKPRPAPAPPAITSPTSTVDARTPEKSPQTPQEFLQLGIKHHEANRLKEAAACFEKSAKLNGGCGVGMLMWGLTLRHGWGCEKNEKVGFNWLRRAAESAVEDLENARTGAGVDLAAVQTEMVIAIYEVGQCFFQGWGVAKDQKMAVSYYTVAARLGDPDAQCDLAFCLANGKGCKKDRKEAAKWYRAAVAQGSSDIGLAWIYKEKFQ